MAEDRIVIKNYTDNLSITVIILNYYCYTYQCKF